MLVDDINIGDLVRVWGWEELLVVSDISFICPNRNGALTPTAWKAAR